MSSDIVSHTYFSVDPEIVVIEFGGQLTKNIARFYFEKGIPVRIIDWNMVTQQQLEKSKGVILSGSSFSVNDKNSPTLNFDPIKLAKDGIGVLGLCYGEQLLAQKLGGIVKKADRGEYGFAEIEINEHNRLFDNFDNNIIWMSHRDQVVKLPENFIKIAQTKSCDIAAYTHNNLPIWGLQFHPEASHTIDGYKILDNFGSLCGCEGSGWDVDQAIDDAISYIQQQVGDGRAIMACSGGVDSTTTAVLAKRALGDRLKVVYVDNGLMRKGETNDVVSNLNDLGIDVDVVKSDLFLERLKGVYDPEQRRIIIGTTFFEVFSDYARKLEGYDFLVQGTIAPDRIETVKGSSKEDKGIKTHHNLVKTDKLELVVVEPVRDYFKYQIRKIAQKVLGDSPIARRQPYPGPGLGIRCAKQLNKENLDTLRDFTISLEKEFEQFCPSQYFGVMLNNFYKGRDKKAEKILRKYLNNDVKAYRLVDVSVGVKGDERVVEDILVIDSHQFQNLSRYERLKLQSDLTGKLDVCRIGIRVCGNVETAGLVGDYNKLIRKYRKQSTQEDRKKIEKYSHCKVLENLNNTGWIAMCRAFDTIDFMTGVPTEISWNTLQKVGKRAMELGASFSFYEITTKPSSTTELY